METIFSPTETSNKFLQLTFPLPRPGAPLATVVVSHDPMASVGMKVAINLTGAGIDAELIAKLQRGAEEFIRRGGGLRVIRWIWDHSKASINT